ncbi:MAG: DUF4430 domain-containing protein [Coriobacteriales bacterium]
MSSNEHPNSTDERIAPQSPRGTEHAPAAKPSRRAWALGAACAAALALGLGLFAIAPALAPSPEGTPTAPLEAGQGKQEGGAQDSAAKPDGEGSDASQPSSGPDTASTGAEAPSSGDASSGSAKGPSSPAAGGDSPSKPKDQPSHSKPAAITVTISIDASRAGSGYGHASLGSCSLSLPAGSTAYDALVACGASIGGNSTYVSSINGLAEKQCGALSGWMYSVDGVFPQVSCGKFQLEDGAQLVWAYSLDMGDDLS